MGIAIDTVGAYAAAPGAAFSAATVSPGDSFTVRSFSGQSSATLERLIYSGDVKGGVRVTSANLHDDVTGISFHTDGEPSVMLMPPEQGQRLVSGDTLSVDLEGSTVNDALGALSIVYNGPSWAAARLHQWGDISSLIKFIKPVQVAVTADATVGTWVDTLITTTENQLKAGMDYAVLGYVVDAHIGLVGVKGSETSNLRICGPGIDRAEDTSDFFVQWANREGGPRIPVFNADNRNAFYVSVLDNAASTAVNVTLVLAMLSQTLSS